MCPAHRACNTAVWVRYGDGSVSESAWLTQADNRRRSAPAHPNLTGFNGMDYEQTRDWLVAISDVRRRRPPLRRRGAARSEIVAAGNGRGQRAGALCR